MTSKSREGDLSSQLHDGPGRPGDCPVATCINLTAQVEVLEGKVKNLQAEKMARVLNAAVRPARQARDPRAEASRPQSGK
jgi:hypothetical protein